SLVQQNSANDEPARHISASRSEDGDLAVLYVPTGGKVAIRPGILKEGLKAQWCNPRSRQHLAARPEGEHGYRTPDENDWILLFH
ncbi:MAG: hypothetical protein JW810_06020, partial [Sedimentisphaerales bacterium]|nr:hypothetical protein [Sedimentisphaerales bacterium]